MKVMETIKSLISKSRLSCLDGSYPERVLDMKAMETIKSFKKYAGQSIGCSFLPLYVSVTSLPATFFFTRRLFQKFCLTNMIDEHIRIT